MIITILSIILFLIFTVLGTFHFYWLFGGKWGIDKVIPSKNNQEISLSIPKLATIIVGLVLVLFGFVYLIESKLISVQLPNWTLAFCYWFIPLIFIIRAIGDLKYVGFFKKVKNTKFAKADSKIFSPLCLAIGLIGILIQLIK